jgi:hypothetical protein
MNSAVRRVVHVDASWEHHKEIAMANSKSASTPSSRGRAQDRARVAGGQKHEVQYEAKKTRASAAEVKHAVKKVGNSRSKVERDLSK